MLNWSYLNATLYKYHENCMSKLALQSEPMYSLTRAHRGVCTPMRRHVRMPSSMAMKSVEALRVSLPACVPVASKVSLAKKWQPLLGK